jgi:hypothetical protein
MLITIIRQNINFLCVLLGTFSAEHFLLVSAKFYIDIIIGAWWGRDETRRYRYTPVVVMFVVVVVYNILK